ncbi:MAG: potassium transporter [Hyphomicrobiales bacterium]|nr:potassium transporter [Hyphomicrobiales bacterium]
MHKSKRNQKPRRRLLGGRNVETVGLGVDFWSDFNHRCLTASWPVFFSGAVLAFLALNCLFALVYMLGDQPVANAPGDFAHYLYFSIETLTTVGYGDMHPQTHFGHIVASVELFLNVFTVAILTGLIFYRFSRPQAQFLFAERAVVTTFDGKRSLMLRVANRRQNSIVGPTAKVWIAMTIVTAEGESFRRFNELPLVRSQNPLFVLSWTMIHEIDEKSPLFGMDAEGMEVVEGIIMVMIEGYDETAAQTVVARKTYDRKDVLFGHRYIDVLEDGDGEVIRLNYDKFHHTAPET